MDSASNILAIIARKRRRSPAPEPSLANSEPSEPRSTPSRPSNTPKRSRPTSEKRIQNDSVQEHAISENRSPAVPKQSISEASFARLENKIRRLEQTVMDQAMIIEAFRKDCDQDFETVRGDIGYLTKWGFQVNKRLESAEAPTQHTPSSDHMQNTSVSSGVARPDNRKSRPGFGKTKTFGDIKEGVKAAANGSSATKAGSSPAVQRPSARKVRPSIPKKASIAAKEGSGAATKGSARTKGRSNVTARDHSSVLEDDLA